MTISIDTNEVRDRCLILRNGILQNRNKIELLLSNVESYETVKDEITRSLYVLENIDEEIPHFPPQKIKQLSSFLPLNLPLYSYVIFAFVPSLYSQNVYTRSSSLLVEIFNELNEIFSPFSDVQLVKVSRSDFLEKYLKKSEVVVFTGKYENAAEIIEQISNDTLFLHNGAGINPLLITENADVEMAIKKSVYVKIFNSGQDCAGPDAILVSKTIFKSYLDNLALELRNNVKIGEYNDKTVRVGPLLDRDHLLLVASYLNRFKDKIVYGGIIDVSKSIVYPTIIVQNINEKITYEEYFSPVFKLITYDNDSELSKYFEHPVYLQNAMYVSVFGTSSYVDKIRFSTLIHNKSIHEIEFGTKEYGGYSKKGSFVFYKGVFKQKPILISREVSENIFNIHAIGSSVDRTPTLISK